MRSVTRKEMQDLDTRATFVLSIPSLVLMENAGRSVADIASEMAPPGSRIIIICGKGNNGGDGFVCARHLHIRGFEIKVVLLGNIDDVAAKGDASINMRVLCNMKLPIIDLSDERYLYKVKEILDTSDLVIDAIFGTGLTREVGDLEKAVIEAINSSGKKIISIDIPSGLDCDSGRPLGIAVRANKTVTMGLPKVGFQSMTARDYIGEVIVADIGVPYSCI